MTDHRPTRLSELLQELVRAPEEELGSAWDRVLGPGTVVGRFELLREVGRGGFGIVFEARDRELGRDVAFKAVRASGRRDIVEERLLREAEAAARLSHPNIVTLFDVGRTEQGPYLVFELLRGCTLAKRLEHGSMSVGEALRIGVEVARGLAHAHARGVVHRDLTPRNVFLCDDGQVKVLDLGMAHAFGRRRVDGGTPGYMAPEQREGGPEDERTDVFALGVMMHEMLVGSRPFADPRAFSSWQPAPVLDVPGVPGLGDLVARMLSKAPVARPRDAEEVLGALQAFRRELPDTPVSGAVRRRRRWRLLPMLAAAALLGGLATALVVAQKTARAPSTRSAASVAVLPFADMSPQKDQEYLADGIAEEILAALARIDGLRVAGRTSSFHFKGRAEDLRVIGTRLNVGAVLEGSVRRSGDRLRVSAQLVNVADGYGLWSETFEREVKDIFAVQDEIARAVASGLRVNLLGTTSDATAHRRTTPEAYAEFLKGRHFFQRATAADLRLSIQAFERSIALDPAYAPSHAALSWAHFLFPTFAPELDFTASAALAKASAERAVALAADLPDGYTARGWLRLAIDQEPVAARVDLEKALSLEPHGGVARRTFASLLASTGRVEEAITTLKAVLSDDPLDVAAARNLGNYYNAMGRLRLAREVLQGALELEPRESRVNRELCFTEILDRRPEAALAVAERNPVPWMRTLIRALAHHDLGRAREAGEELDELKRFGDQLAYQIAQVHAWRNEADDAFTWLERARAARDIGLVYVKYDPLLRSLRSDRRYVELLRNLHLPVD